MDAAPRRGCGGGLTRDGGSRLATEERRNFHAPRFAPDGRRISTDFTAADGRDVWVLDLDGAVLTRATFDRDGHDATWTPDGRSLTYGTQHGGVFGLFRTRLGSAEPAESLLTSARLAYTGLWLPDGNTMVTAAASLQPGSAGDIGRWLAFVSNQSGKNEVYVRPLGRPGDQVQVSVAGGTEPVWGPDGRELFYRSGGTSPQLLLATVQTLPSFTITSRRPLFPVSDIVTASPHSNYDVSPDGKSFVMVRLNPSSRIVVLQNLPALVERLRGAGGTR